MFKKRYIWMIIYGAVLFAFTLYVILDTFVITRVYSVETVKSSESGVSIAAEQQNIPDEETAEESVQAQTEEQEAIYSEPEITETAYRDDNISISIEEYREYDTAIYVADIQVSSVEYLKAAFAQGLYGKNVTAETSQIAYDNDAIIAVNGDFYGSQESGYVIRNGRLYRDTSAGREDLVIYENGSFEIINEDSVSAKELMERGAWQVLSFGPAIVMDSEISVSVNEEVGKAMSSNPRTAIGFIDANHYVLVVSDGRTSESEGLSLYELADFMQSIGVKTAYNLDGGGSSTMYYNGEVVNNPTTNGSIRERQVSDIVYLGY